MAHIGEPTLIVIDDIVDMPPPRLKNRKQRKAYKMKMRRLYRWVSETIRDKADQVYWEHWYVKFQTTPTEPQNSQSAYPPSLYRIPLS